MLWLVTEIGEIIKQTFTAAYLFVIQDIAAEVYLEHSQISMMELFYEYS